jgi:hypothetical protein
MARSQIHITLDGWSAPNDTPFMAVIAHFVNQEGNLDHLLLELREIERIHAKVNLSALLVKIS